jgi:hydroxymethylbilane synthase
MSRTTFTPPGSGTTSMNRPLIVGTRGSALALWQANAVRDLIAAVHPGLTAELGIIKPEGDRDKTSSLLTIGGRGVFASALQEALLARSIDLAVHSTKDVPTIEPVGLAIAAYPQREDPRDAVVSRHGVSLADLPASPVIGTSSRRRAVQVLTLRPDATIVDLRGNIDTRLRKSDTAEYDAVILAAAGLTRMGWQDRITEYLPVEEFVPSPGQGALAIETRVAPDPAWELVAALDDPAVSLAVSLEREFLRAMGGGCTTPLGANAVVAGDAVRFVGMMATTDGSRLLREVVTFGIGDAHNEVLRLAQRMMAGLGPAWTGAERPDRPLAGKVALVTGTADFAERTGAAFARDGAHPLPVPTLEVEPSSDPDGLASALDRLAEGHYQWLVVTSRQTVPVLAGATVPETTGIIAVGAATAQRLAEAGFRATFVPDAETSEGVVAALNDRDLTGQRMLCLLGDRAGSTIVNAARERGATVDRVESYRTVAVGTIPAAARATIRQGRVDLAVFPSPSSAKTLVRHLGADLAALSGACLVAIGPTTARAMERLGLPVHVIAASPSPEAVVAGCRDRFSATPQDSHDPV